MKMKYLAVTLLALALIVPISARCAAPPMVELLPPNSLGYVELPDMGVFYYLVSELGQAAIKSLEEEKEVPPEIAVKARAVLEAFDEIKPLLPRSASLGILSLDTQSGQVSFLLTAELSEGLAPLASAATKLLAAAPDIQVTKTEYGTEVVIPHTKLPPIGCAVRENVLYVAGGQGLLDKALSGSLAGGLAQTASFREVHAVIGKSPIITGYVNLDAVRETLLPVLPPEAKKWIELLGLQGVHAAGISLSADEQYVGTNIALQYTTDAPGIPGLLSFPNTAPKGIAYVPEDFSYVTRFSLGPPAEMLKKIQALLQAAEVEVDLEKTFGEMKENLGVDVNQLLASLGGEITLAVKVPETLAIPNMVVCIEATDTEFVMQTVKGVLEKMGVPSTEVEVGGKKIMMITPTIPIPVTPALAADDGVIVIGISSAVVQKALAAKDTGKNIASKPEFKAAMAGLPVDSNVALEYIEMENLGQLLVAGLGMLAGRAPAEAQPVVARAMLYANNAVQDLDEAVEVAYRTPNGLAIQSRWSTRSVMQVLKNGAAVLAKAVIVMHARRQEEPVEEQPTATEEVSVRRSEEVNTDGSAFVDLGPYVTRPLKAMHGEGNDLPFEPGTHYLGDGAYKIPDGVIQLWGEQFTDVPREVKGIKVGQKFKALHILHATGWGETPEPLPDGTQIACYIVNYDDGTAAEIPVKYGVDVRDWWVQRNAPVSEGKIVWTGRNSLSPIRLYSMAWENPHPDKAVASIDYKSAGTVCAPYVIAITADVE
ncbi:MAG: DUF3352 domain-containing protein [bacterium]|nr:DUF3352 domain-containing protein [bacterium]